MRRKALVGIAAALMLATLVIAIVPASAGGLPPWVFFITGNSVVGGVELSVPTSSLGEFWLSEVMVTNGEPSASFSLCQGSGATFRGSFLTIRGTCGVNSQFIGAMISGGGMVNGLVVLTLTFSGKPSTSITFVMRAESTPTWWK